MVSSGDQALAEGIGEVVTERVRLLPGVRVVSFTPIRPRRHAGGADAPTPCWRGIRSTASSAAPRPGTTGWPASASRVLRAGVGAPVFEEAFERPVERAAELPRLVADEMVRWLGVRASSEESSRLSRADDAAPAAFEAYLRGRSAMRHLSEPNVARAIEHFTQALAVNRNHGPSLVGLAECYLLQGVTYGSLPRGKATLLAREAIERALALDGDHAAAVNADAQLRFYLEWDGEGAERAFQRALELSPNSEAVHQHYAMFLVARDRMDAALSQVQSAVAHRSGVDPGPRRAGHGVALHRQPAPGRADVPRSAGRRRRATRRRARGWCGRCSPASSTRRCSGCSTAGRRARPIRRIASSSPRAASRWPGSGQLQEARRIADELLASPKADGEVDAAVGPRRARRRGAGADAARSRRWRSARRARSSCATTPASTGCDRIARFTRLLDGMDFKR